MLTPERRAELRADAENRRLFRFVTSNASDGYPSSGYEPIDEDLLALLDAADERDRLAAQVERVRTLVDPSTGAPFSALRYGDTSEGNGSTIYVPVIHVWKVREALEWSCSECGAPEAVCLAAPGHGARACCPDCSHARWDGAEEAHAYLPITEDADGLTCDICGAELADWAAADEHVDDRHGAH